MAYGFIAETLERFGYVRLGRTEEGWVATARRQRLEAKALGIRMGQTLAKHEVTFPQFSPSRKSEDRAGFLTCTKPLSEGTRGCASLRGPGVDL